LCVLLLQACKPTPNQSTEKLLQRKWLINDSLKKSFITFNINENYPPSVSITLENKLNRSADTMLYGYWKLQNDSVLLIDVLFAKQPNEKIISQNIDSFTFHNTPQNKSISFYKNNPADSLTDNKIYLGQIINGEIKGEIIHDTFLIKQLNPTGLELYNKNKSISAGYIPVKQESHFSITSVLRGLAGILILLFIALLFSANRKAINWKLVATGLLIQLVFAIGVLKVPIIESAFEFISSIFIQIIAFTQEGVKFLFGSFATGNVEKPLQTFVVMVLPTIIFFSALTSLLYYWGILQRVVYAFAWIMKRTMRLSGAESMAAAGNIFLGQTEAPLLVKPYISNMTKSELMCLMTGGMATIAGGVLAAYVGFLGGNDPEQQLFYAKHLLAASVMSAPAAIVAAKILVPETETINPEMVIPREKIGSNALEAITNGTTDGLKLAANVGAMLLAFIALMAMGNYVLGMIGEATNLNNLIATHTAYDKLNFQFLIGYTCSPVAIGMGVPTQDAVWVGQLLGEKTILNEFYAYTSLGSMKSQGLFSSEKSVIMATYILCGFANFASIGIQIGGIGSIAPNKKQALSELGFRALIGGTLACLFTAVVVGMLL
jgi:CNT family concentrative nucleoside transporter